MKPKLFIMCGLSGSGKSSIAKDLAIKYNAEIVSSDAIREDYLDHAKINLIMKKCLIFLIRE